MSIERARRASTVPSSYVSKRLCFAIVAFIGILCLSGGYVLGNMARNEAKKGMDIISINLTSATELLYKKTKRLSPKALNRHEPDKIAMKLLEIFHCDCNECGKMKNKDAGEYVRALVNHEVTKLIKSVHNASRYVDSLREQLLLMMI